MSNQLMSMDRDSNLCIGKAELGGDLVSVRRRQILLVQEPLLQLEDLVVGESRPGLPLLLGRLLRRERQLRWIQFWKGIRVKIRLGFSIRILPRVITIVLGSLILIMGSLVHARDLFEDNVCGA